jgi:hypothetical protein
VLHRVRGYRKFPDFDSWAWSTHQPGTPDDEHNIWTARNTTYYDKEELRVQLMSYREWVAMSRELKEALYDQYKVDRDQQHKEIQEITNALDFRGLIMTHPKYIHPYKASATGSAVLAFRQLSEALTALPNLSALKHEPGFLHDEEWALRWRDLYFYPHSIEGNTDYEEDEDVEALQLSIVLQLLARLRGKDRRLQRMSMYVGGPAFATSERLQLLCPQKYPVAPGRTQRQNYIVAESRVATLARSPTNSSASCRIWSYPLFQDLCPRARRSESKGSYCDGTDDWIESVRTTGYWLYEKWVQRRKHRLHIARS